MVIVDRRDLNRLALEFCASKPPVTGVGKRRERVGGSACARPAPRVVLVGRQALLAYGPEATARLRPAGAERVILVGTGNRDQIRVEAMRVDRTASSSATAAVSRRDGS